MCVIVVKKQDKKFPSKETLRNCWYRNPDGAGFMFAKDGQVHIRKGFMDWADFWTELNETRDLYGDFIPYVMHFRIATHGKVSQECCHPFPLSDNIEDLRLIESTSKIGIAHNGIIPNRATSDNISDTMDYIASFLYPLSKLSDDWMLDTNSRKLIDDTLCSKLAVLSGDGSIELFGEFERYDGCLFSNDSYTSFARAYGYIYGSKAITPISPYEMFKACEFCQMYDECEAYGCACKDEEDATQNCLFDEQLFSIE